MRCFVLWIVRKRMLCWHNWQYIVVRTSMLSELETASPDISLEQPPRETKGDLGEGGWVRSPRLSEGGCIISDTSPCCLKHLSETKSLNEFICFGLSNVKTRQNTKTGLKLQMRPKHAFTAGTTVNLPDALFLLFNILSITSPSKTAPP